MAEVKRSKLNSKLLDKSYKLKMDWIKENCAGGRLDPMDQENFEGTDLRASKAFAELCRPKNEIKENCKSFLKTFNIATENKVLGMITQGPVVAVGLCPHHLLPVQYEIYLSYVPDNNEDAKVLGLSKLARIAKEVPKYPMLQEDVARNIADILYKGNEWLDGINSQGSAVMVIGSHGCVSCRGVESLSLTSSVEVRGTYLEKDLEDRFYEQVNAIRLSTLKR